MEEQSGANLTSMTVSSHLHELKSSGVGDCNAMTNPPPTGGGLEAGEQEPPSTSCEKYNMIFLIFIERQMRPQYIYSVA